MDVALILDHLVPAAEYGGSLTENTRAAYDALVWNDARPKPAWPALVAAENDGMAAYAAGLPKTDVERLADLLEAKGAITAQERDGVMKK